SAPALPHPALSTLSLHDALPISRDRHTHVVALAADKHAHQRKARGRVTEFHVRGLVRYRELHLGDELVCRQRRLVHAEEEIVRRSEEHTSELQSRRDLVCRLLLE